LNPLEGRTGWITGASRGIGRATSVEAARQGTRLILTARSLDGLKDTAHEIEQGGGIPPALVLCDVADLDQLNSAFKEVRTHSQQLDFVVNNAGILRDALLGMRPMHSCESCDPILARGVRRS
jgi:3-oxoacyl-[acyl-carrier protein] reductase